MNTYCAASWVHWGGGAVVECGNKALRNSPYCKLHVRLRPNAVTARRAKSKKEGA